MAGNQPEGGIVKKTIGIAKATGHSFKRATLGDIYSLIETKADEAREHREENFRYLNTRIDSQIGEVRQEIGSINQRVDSLGQKIDTQVGQLRQEMNSRMDSFDRKIDQVNKRLDDIMKVLLNIAKK